MPQTSFDCKIAEGQVLRSHKCRYDCCEVQGSGRPAEDMYFHKKPRLPLLLLCVVSYSKMQAVPAAVPYLYKNLAMCIAHLHEEQAEFITQDTSCSS